MLNLSEIETVFQVENRKKHQFMHFNYTKGFPYPLTDQCDRLGDGVPLDLDNDFVDMMSSRHFDFFL